MIVWSLFITWYTWKGRPDTLKGSSEKKNKVAPAEGKYCKNGKSFMMNLYTTKKKMIFKNNIRNPYMLFLFDLYIFCIALQNKITI